MNFTKTLLSLLAVSSAAIMLVVAADVNHKFSDPAAGDDKTKPQTVEKKDDDLIWDKSFESKPACFFKLKRKSDNAAGVALEPCDWNGIDQDTMKFQQEKTGEKQ